MVPPLCAQIIVYVDGSFRILGKKIMYKHLQIHDIETNSINFLSMISLWKH